MFEGLHEGLTHEFTFQIGDNKTVPALYPESDEFRQMPAVFATGFMVGFIEWACIDAIKPYIDWPREQSLGTHVNLSHLAATPPGFKITARVTLKKIDGRRLLFEVEAEDGMDTICTGSHERFIVDREKFDATLARKIEAAAP